MWHGMYWLHGGMWFFPLIFIIACVVVIFFIVGGRHSSMCGDSRNNFNITQETPIEILKKRYAKGEITKDEFERMKKDLSS